MILDTPPPVSYTHLPFAHKGALVVFPQVGDEGGKGIIFVIIIMGHGDTSLSLRRRLFPMGLRLALIGTFFPALFQPFLDGGLFLYLLLPGAVSYTHLFLVKIYMPLYQVHY